MGGRIALPGIQAAVQVARTPWLVCILRAHFQERPLKQLQWRRSTILRALLSLLLGTTGWIDRMTVDCTCFGRRVGDGIVGGGAWDGIHGGWGWHFDAAHDPPPPGRGMGWQFLAAVVEPLTNVCYLPHLLGSGLLK